MKLTKEGIEEWRRRMKQHGFMDGVDALCDLALLGLSLQWPPEARAEDFYQGALEMSFLLNLWHKDTTFPRPWPSELRAEFLEALK